MNMKKMNKLSVFILIAVITCMLCGCTSLFTKKDTLIFVQGANTSDSKTGMTAQVKITDFSEIYSGTLLDFYPQSAMLSASCVKKRRTGLRFIRSFSMTGTKPCRSPKRMLRSPRRGLTSARATSISRSRIRRRRTRPCIWLTAIKTKKQS